MPVFPCHVCRTSLSAEESQVGQLVRCPTCLSTLRVPKAVPVEALPVGVGASQSQPPLQQPRTFAPSAPPPPGPRPGTAIGSMARMPIGKRFGFNCGYCSSRLEATESQCAQEGTCPTCGNTIIIPILDRYGRLIDPMTGKIIKQDPHPVHAYAAAGERAPKIVRHPDGSQSIQC